MAQETRKNLSLDDLDSLFGGGLFDDEQQTAAERVVEIVYKTPEKTKVEKPQESEPVELLEETLDNAAISFSSSELDMEEASEALLKEDLFVEETSRTENVQCEDGGNDDSYDEDDESDDDEEEEDSEDEVDEDSDDGSEADADSIKDTAGGSKGGPAKGKPKKERKPTPSATEGAVKRIKDHILGMAAKDAVLARKLQNPAKSWEECSNYVFGEAFKKLRTTKGGILDDSEVYGLAVHYWQEEKVEINKDFDPSRFFVAGNGETGLTDEDKARIEAEVRQKVEDDYRRKAEEAEKARRLKAEKKAKDDAEKAAQKAKEKKEAAQKEFEEGCSLFGGMDY